LRHRFIFSFGPDPGRAPPFGLPGVDPAIPAAVDISHLRVTEWPQGSLILSTVGATPRSMHASEVLIEVPSVLE